MKLERKPTQQDITWFLDLNSNKKLDLNPEYQRKSIWTPSDREFFLDTVMNNFPCPPIFLHKDIDANGKVTYRVIDGKQRLTSIILFAENKFALGYTDGETTPYTGKTFNQLLEEEKKTFWNYMIPVEMVNVDNIAIVRGIFDRLNRNNQRLNAQELRKARYGGELQAFIETESEDASFWGSVVRFTKRDISRMADHQFIAEIAMLVISGKVVGFNQDELDAFYAEHDESFEKSAYVMDIFSKMKAYFIKLNNYDHVIDKFYSTRSNTYTLWSVFIPDSENLPDPTTTSKKLQLFGEQLKGISETENPDKNVETYSANNKSATTDKKQRDERAASLRNFLKESSNQ